MKQLIHRAVYGTLGIGILAGAMLATPATIAAKGSDVIKIGSCTMGSDWKLKAKPDNGRLEVEFEVDQNRNRQIWNVVLKHNGSAFFTGQRTTQAPSRSFSVTRFTSNAAAADTILGKATNPKTGEVCKGTLNI